MSISLPNGTILAAPSSQPQLSAAVTRILHLANFSKELKTRDIQNIFKEWETDKGGLRIKWLDDVNALVVFADATVAKRAYLSLLLSPPPIFLPPASIRPYDRPDAAQIIQSLAARTMGHRSAVSSALTSGSITSLPTFNAAHGRTMSTSNTGMMNGFVMPKPPAPKNATARTPNGTPQRIEVHNRTGSASSSWGRQAGAGVLNFSMPSSSSAPRLPTHSESSGIASRSSSTSELGDPIGAEENDTSAWNSATPRGSGPGAGTGQKIRRESVSADKALREVQKALASVEAQG